MCPRNGYTVYSSLLWTCLGPYDASIGGEPITGTLYFFWSENCRAYCVFRNSGQNLDTKSKKYEQTTLSKATL